MVYETACNKDDGLGSLHWKKMGGGKKHRRFREFNGEKLSI